jgi:RNA polymerase sigma factor (sigma-70 family)
MSDSPDDPEDEGRRPVTATGRTLQPTPELTDHAAKVVEFTAFYRQSVPKLVAFLRWHGAPLPDAADCAQEALTLAFQNWSTIDSPRAWCRLVASRLYARRVATIQEDAVDDLARAGGSPLLAPDTALDEFEQRHTILALLGQLPPRQRQVMAWTYDGATPTDIAEALQISPDTVRSNLYKARTTLREITGESP